MAGNAYGTPLYLKMQPGVVRLSPPASLARSGDAHPLVLALAVLSDILDSHERGFRAETSSIAQVSRLPAEDDEPEVADRSVGNHRNRRTQAPVTGGDRVCPGNDRYLPVEDEGEPGQASGSGHGVCGPFQGLVQQRRLGKRPPYR